MGENSVHKNPQFSKGVFGRRLLLNKLPFSENIVHEIAKKVSVSNISNYYDGGLLARISPVLSLCAKAYVNKNEYEFISV